MDANARVQFYYEESAIHRPSPADSDDEVWTSEEAIIAQALGILERRLTAHRSVRFSLATNRFSEVRKYVRLHLAQLDIERFDILLLDSRGQLIKHIPVAYGSPTEVTVYTKEITRMAVTHNAASVLLIHNHPSGLAEPSEPDKKLTEAIKDQLRVVGISLFDHVIVARESSEVYSFEMNSML